MAEIARYSRDVEKFDLLEDYTAVDWPRREKRFDLIIVYSFPQHAAALKIPLAADEAARRAPGEILRELRKLAEREISTCSAFPSKDTRI